MDKIILLDWDGPISNNRTWKMPGCVDPVAIQLLNDLTVAGWQTVLTSTIRGHFFIDERCEERTDEQAKIAATKFMRDHHFNVRWYEHSWCTDRNKISARHLEVAQWIMDTDPPENAVYLVVDDEHFPHAFLEGGRMMQCYARPDAGIDYLSISEAYRIGEMSDEQLERNFETVEYEEEGEDGE